MNKAYWMGTAFVLASSFLHAGCVDEETAPATGDSETSDVEPTPLASELLAVDVVESRDCRLFGKRTDYDYPLHGRRVTRHEFHVETKGHADATIESMENDLVRVHAWCDAYSGYSFTLKVWVEQ